MMARCKNQRSGIAENRLANVIPHEHFEREVKCRKRRGLHHRSTGRWTAEDDDLGVAKSQTDPIRLATVIDDANSVSPRALTSSVSLATTSSTEPAATLVTAAAPSSSALESLTEVPRRKGASHRSRSNRTWHNPHEVMPRPDFASTRICEASNCKQARGPEVAGGVTNAGFGS